MHPNLEQVRAKLYAAVIADALDALGFCEQSPDGDWRSLTTPGVVLAGRCRTTLWEDMEGEDPKPYELELRAVDQCAPDDVMVCAAAGSMRSGIWGELLTTAAMNGGCVGAIIDGASRDVRQISGMRFPVFARGTRIQDSLHRQRVVEIDVPVVVGGVTISPGELVVADNDGVVVVPKSVEQQVLQRAWEKVAGEDRTREAIRHGMKAEEAYRRFGVL